MKDKKAKILNFILPLISILSLILLWVVASKSVDNQFILPSVKSTAERFVLLFRKSEFYISLLSTFLRSFLAFIISFVVAFILAVLSVKISHVKRAIAPIMALIRALPTIAVVLLLLLWTNSLIAPVIVTMLVVLPTSFTHIESAFSSLDKNVAEAGRVDGGDEFQVFKRVEMPQALPSILNAIGSGMSLNFKLMVAAEVLSQTAKCMGYLLNTSKVYFETADMFALVCVCVLVCAVIEFAFMKIAKKVGEWK